MAGTRPLNPDEQVAVAAALPQFPARDKALVTFLMNTGYRVSEVLSVAVGDVFQDGQVTPRVRVARAGMKGGQGPRRRAVTSRSVPLNEEVAGALTEYLFERFGSGGPTDPAAPLFLSRQGGRAMSRWQANRVVHAVLAEARVEGSQIPGAFGSHSMRKVFARRVYEASGHDIVLTRAALGHSQIQTTVGYLAVGADDVDRAVMALASPKRAAPAVAAEGTAVRR